MCWNQIALKLILVIRRSITHKRTGVLSLSFSHGLRPAQSPVFPKMALLSQKMCLWYRALILVKQADSPFERHCFLLPQRWCCLHSSRWQAEGTLGKGRAGKRGARGTSLCPGIHLRLPMEKNKTKLADLKKVKERQ